MPYKNRADYLANRKAWLKVNRHRYADQERNASSARHANLRAQTYGSPGLLTPADVAKVLSVGRCHYCGSTALLGIDHVVALADGGPNAVGNLVAACRRCNASKWRGERPYRWSREHDACTACGQTDRRHDGKGLCERCSRRERSRRERTAGLRGGRRST